jgi:hypothetical protein
MPVVARLAGRLQRDDATVFLFGEHLQQLGWKKPSDPAYMVRGARGQQCCCYLGDLVDVFGFVVKLQKHSRMKNGFGRFIAH